MILEQNVIRVFSRTQGGLPGTPVRTTKCWKKFHPLYENRQLKNRNKNLSIDFRARQQKSVIKKWRMILKLVCIGFMNNFLLSHAITGTMQTINFDSFTRKLLFCFFLNFLSFILIFIFLICFVFKFKKILENIFYGVSGNL